MALPSDAIAAGLISTAFRIVSCNYFPISFSLGYKNALAILLIFIGNPYNIVREKYITDILIISNLD